MPTTTTTTPTSADHQMDTSYQDEFTENLMSSPQQREDVSHDLRLDPTTPAGSDAQTGARRAGEMPRADGGEPDFDDDVAANTPDAENDDDEEEDTTA